VNNPEEMDQAKLLNALAHLISIIFHPLLLPSFLFAIILLHAPILLGAIQAEGRMLLLYVIFVSTFLFPLITVFLFYPKKTSSVYKFVSLGNGKDRVKPFLLIAIIYGCLAYICQFLRINEFFTFIFGSMAAGIFLTAIISNFWKISIHAISISSFTGFLFIINERFADGELFYFIILSVLISGVVLSSRLYLNEHTPRQILLGWALGLALSQVYSLYTIHL
jgi:membrane-associated phospholipid phosphatase